MGRNARVYYAIRAVAVTPDLNATSFASGNIVHGVQTVTDNVNFNTEDILELGQIDSYTSMEDKPTVSCTIEKVLDGYPLVYWMATASSGVIANNSWELGGRTRDACKIGLAIYDDYETTASGISNAFLVISGAYIDSLNYTLPVDGNSTESVTFTANDRTWTQPTSEAMDWFDWDFDGNDEPQNANAAVLKRWNVDMSLSEFPTDIYGITAGGLNPEISGAYAAHMQNITISTNLGRTDLHELGRKPAYYQYANYPVDVTAAIDIITDQGDMKDAAANEINLTNQIINILVSDDDGNHRIRFNLGNKNKLTTIDNSDGGTGGGVMTTTYNYTNKNTLTITGDDDPAGSSP